MLPVEQYTSPFPAQVSVVASGDEVVVADGLRFEVRVFALNGDLRRIIRVADPATPIPDSLWDARSRQLPGRAPAAAAAVAARVYPAIGEVLADSGGRIWVQDYRQRERWTVFEGTGTLLGSVVMPALDGDQSRVVWLGKDEVALRHADPDGAPVITFHRLTPVRRQKP